MLRRDVEDTDLGGKNHPIVVRDIVAGRTETIAVERRAEDIAVRENHGGRAVPRLHHGRIVMVEVLLLLIHELVMLPRLRDHHHDGQRKIEAAHVEELERVVKHCGVGRVLRNDREDLVCIVLKDRCRHRLLAGKHTVDISANCIDLAVVGDHAVRMCPLPARRRICRESGVDHRNCCLVVMVLQVLIEGAELLDQEHSLIDNGS